MDRAPLAAKRSHIFVEHYPDLTYRQFHDGSLFPGGRRLSFDLLKPVSDEPTPLLVFVKGGGFRNVHRARYLPAIVPLAQRGIAIASVDYRTSNEAQFPAPLDDVRAAIRYFREHAEELNFLPHAVAVWGNSAGATIAAQIAGAGEDDVCAAAVWYGVHDPGRSESYREPDSVIRAAFGSPDRADSPWIRPSTFVRPTSAPMLLLHGTEDETVDFEQSTVLAETLADMGIDHEFLAVEGGSHSFAQMCTRSDALDRTFTFLETRLRSAAEA